jgi:serine/threonine protein kinase
MTVYEKLSQSNSDAVLQFIEEVRDDKYLGFVTQFAEGGDLASYVRERGVLPVDEVQRIGIRIASAIKEFHALDVIHRDLKPQNVLRRNGEWYLVDFGISKNRSRLITQKTYQGYASHGYSAPEQFDGVEAKPSADVYAFGKLMVFMLTGNTDVDLVAFPTWRQLILRCTSQQPDERPSIDHVLNDLIAIPT